MNKHEAKKQKESEQRVKFCKYWDCGWCYSNDSRANNTNGSCNNATTCDVLSSPKD